MLYTDICGYMDYEDILWVLSKVLTEIMTSYDLYIVFL